MALARIASLIVLVSTATAAPEFVLPAGFRIDQVAGAPQVQYPMFACWDERGRLFVAESSGLDLYQELQKLTRKCRVSVLEDSDGDGRFERAHVFADNLVFPMGLAWRQGKLYVADPPDVVTFEDTDGDGQADRRTVVLSGFGHTDNGSLHGLIFGPDGWLYMTLGQPDGYQLKRPDGSILSGKSGALLRCRPDGSEVEVVCRGFENLVEVVFLPSGEIIGTDNWFSLPSAGVRDALVHLLEGALYPLQVRDAGTPFLVSGEPLPAIALYPAVALSGLMRYRGSSFPEPMRENLFSAQFNTRKVVRHRLSRNGSTFQTIDEDFVTTNDPDFHPSDVLETAEGSLLIVDTGSWYVQHCPTGRIRPAPARGGIYRVRFSAAAPIIDAPGLNLEWSSLNATQLTARLEDPRPWVRDWAMEALSGSAAGPALAALLRSTAKNDARQSAVWALARIAEQRGRGNEARMDLPLPTNDDPDLLALVVRAAGRVGAKASQPDLIPLLKHHSSQVRLAAAEALAHSGDTAAVPALVEGLAANADRFQEHALIHALHRLATRDDLIHALDHQHPRVQTAALVLLDQPPHSSLEVTMVLSRLRATDPALRQAARNSLRKHPEWTDQAAQTIRTLLAESGVSTEESWRDLVLAFQSDEGVQQLMAVRLANQSLPVDQRGALLEIVTRITLADLPPSWIPPLAQTLRQGSDALRLQVARLTRSRPVPELLSVLGELAEQNDLAPELRLEAIRATRHSSPAIYEFLVHMVDPQQAPGLRLAAAEILSRMDWPKPADDPIRLLSHLKNDRLISPPSVLPLLLKSEGAGLKAAWSYLMESIEAGWEPDEEAWRFMEERVPASAREEFERLRAQSTTRTQQRREQLARYVEDLTGGDPNRGQALFLNKAACATCHRVGQHGGLVGPDLTKIGAIRSGRDLIESLLFPSSSLAQGYEAYDVTLKNGESLTGIRARQPDDSFVLRDATGAETRLRPDQIETVERLKLSLMPEGLLSALPRSDVRDLLAYLQSLKEL